MKYVIVGGTGTLGSMLIARLATDGNEVVCISRDELKQQQLRRRYPQVRYMLGDIRDKSSLGAAFSGADVVFHVAALKHVDVLEENPTEAIKTNVQGTINVAEAAIEAGVPRVVFSSTDKAVLPINTYGMTKAISEKYLLGLNEKQKTTKFSVFKWGNVISSRGSAIPAFAEAISTGVPVKITHPDMSRFWIRIEDAVAFMLNNYIDAPTDQACIPPMKAATVLRVVDALAQIAGKNYSFEVIGIRPGEKIHETIYSSHEYCLRSDNTPQYTDAELSNLLNPSGRSEVMA